MENKQQMFPTLEINLSIDYFQPLENFCIGELIINESLIHTINQKQSLEINPIIEILAGEHKGRKVIINPAMLNSFIALNFADRKVVYFPAYAIFGYYENI